MDPKNRERFDNLVPVIANSEVRALMLGGMSLHNDNEGSPLTKTGFDRMLHNMQGDEPGWELAGGRPFTYCRDFFEPAHIATPQYFKKASRIVTGYKISRLGNGLGMGIAGAGLDGSLRFPEVSLQPLLGRTEKVKGSFVQRLGWLRALVAAEGDSVECTALTAHLAEARDRAEAVTQMTKGSFSKLVTIEEDKKQVYNPQLTITGEKYRGGRNLIPERRAIYSAMDELATAAQGPVHISFDDFMKYIASTNKDIDLKHLRKILVISINPRQENMTGLERTQDKTDGSDSSGSSKKLRLKSKYQEPLGVLLDNFDQVMTPSGLKHFKKRAVTIASNPDHCAELMAKARRARQWGVDKKTPR
jgi:hypothetical protein